VTEEKWKKKIRDRLRDIAKALANAHFKDSNVFPYVLSCLNTVFESVEYFMEMERTPKCREKLVKNMYDKDST
jgi:hypothetical protein